MRRPPAGLCVPVTIREVVDGDTVKVSLRSSAIIYSIRLLECWAPEMHEPGGPEAKEKVEGLLDPDFSPTPHLWIPFENARPEYLFQDLTSLSRPLGHLWHRWDDTVSGWLCDMHYAFRTKQQLEKWRESEAYRKRILPTQWLSPLGGAKWQTEE